MAEMIAILDGHEQKSPFLMDQFKEAAFKRGFGIRHIKQIDQCDIIDGKLGDIITDYAIMRGVTIGSSEVDNVIIAEWADKNRKKIINMHSLGGVATASCDKVLEGYAFSNNPRIAENSLPTYDAKDLRNIMKVLHNKKVKYPFVLKPKNGSLGKGIRLIEKEKDILAGGENLMGMMIQSFVPSECDWRVYVVGGVAVGIIKKGEKESKKNDFQAYATGITIEEETDIRIRERLSELAVEMTASLGIEYSGCDITMDKATGKLYALEANNSPAWVPEYIEIMGDSVAEYLMDWIYDCKTTQKKSVYAKILAYVPKRIKYLSRKTQNRYNDIINWVEQPKIRKSDSLEARLQNCYLKMKTEKISKNDLLDIENLIDEVEKTPLCWNGNYIGSNVYGEDGNLERGCIPSAYYLSIRKKYDKMYSNCKLKG